jgi:hypothetical protein
MIQNWGGGDLTKKKVCPKCGKNLPIMFLDNYQIICKCGFIINEGCFEDKG